MVWCPLVWVIAPGWAQRESSQKGIGFGQWRSKGGCCNDRIWWVADMLVGEDLTDLLGSAAKLSRLLLLWKSSQTSLEPRGAKSTAHIWLTSFVSFTFLPVCLSMPKRHDKSGRGGCFRMWNVVQRSCQIIEKGMNLRISCSCRFPGQKQVKILVWPSLSSLHFTIFIGSSCKN